MRIPFFSLRRKPKQNGAKKTSLMCCLHPPSDSVKLPSEEMTTVVRQSSSSSCSSRRSGAFCIRQHSVPRINTNAKCQQTPPPPPVRPVQTAFSMARSVSSNAETAEAMSPLSRLDDTPSGTSLGRRSPRKGPGIGSVDDSPPTRMSREKPTADLFSIARPTRRRDNCGAQAPQLPTRLEVCVDRNRRKGAYQPILTDSAISMNSDKSIGSHPLTADSVSPMGGSISPGRSRSPAPLSRSPTPRRSCSPAMNMNRTRSPYQMMNICNGAGSSKSRSPAPSSRRSSESHPEEMNNQPSKQQLETKWDWDDGGIVAPREMEMQPSMKLEERGQPHGVRDAIPRLHRWQLQLKLDWVSETSNDLVAEVRLTDLKTPLATTSSESSDQSYFSEFSRDGRQLSARRSKRQLNQLDAETAKINQSNVVALVDRVLSELQKQKRSARNKERMRGRDHRNRHDRRTHGPYQTDDQSFSFRRELSPEVMSPGQRRQRRQEVLQAFEVLISKMESKISSAGAVGHMSGTFSERCLTEAVFGDLRDEVSRLQQDLSDRGSSGENNAWTMALCNFMPFASALSHKSEQSDEDDGEFSFHKSSKERQIQSVPVESTFLPFTFPETEPIERTFSCLTELQSAPQSPLSRYVPNRKDGTKERLAKIALLNEEMLLMNGSNMDACYA